MDTPNVYAVIPARYESTRFPGKPLTPLLGKPMILWVAEACSTALGPANVIVATDDDRIRATAEKAGYRVEITSSSALTGTDRVAEVALKLGGHTVLNVQGDEPMISPADIRRAADFHQKHPEFVINCYVPISARENPERDTIPKVVISQSGQLIYASRSLIPGSKLGSQRKTQAEYFKQVCIYAFSPAQLKTFTSVSNKTPLEQIEDIEILRFLEQDQVVHMVRADQASIAVDTPEDVDLVEAAIKEARSSKSHGRL